jgi:pimeloyl-ACP methyl ester carboxylesterase
VAHLARPDGVQLWFELYGDPGSAPLLLLEGLGGDISGWRRNIPMLAKECFVVACDHRGNGRSDDPKGPVSMGTYVRDALAVLDEVGVDRAHLYGQSFGGMVAIEAALTHPERVRSLILAATNAGPSRAIKVDPPAVPKGVPWRALYAPGFPEAHPEHVADDLAAVAAGVQHQTGERRQWEAMQDFDVYDRLRELRVPTLVLYGTEDRLVAPANAEVLAAAISGAELRWLAGAGHMLHSEQAQAADGAVLAFIRSHP